MQKIEKLYILEGLGATLISSTGNVLAAFKFDHYVEENSLTKHEFRFYSANNEHTGTVDASTLIIERH